MRFSKPTGNTIVAAVIVVAGWSLSGCGSGSASPDGSDSTGRGGHPDASATGLGGRGGTGTAGTGAAGTGAAGTGTAGTGTAGTGGGGAAGATGTLADLGKACTADSNCTGGLTCMLATGKVIIGSEGPANGYCSKMCSADADCSSGGVCLNVSDTGATPVGYCFQTCTFGSAASTSKCHGRPDVACLTIDDTTTPTLDICNPLCSQDSDCPSTRKCDLFTGLCADTAPAGDPLGAHCTTNADAGTSNCAGFCLPIGSATSTAAVANVCTMACVVGSLNACNWGSLTTSLTSGGVHGVCALSSSTADVGDIGFCSQECDTAADCSDKTDPGVTCDTSIMSTTGHGICTWG